MNDIIYLFRISVETRWECGVEIRVQASRFFASFISLKYLCNLEILYVNIIFVGITYVMR